MEYNKYVEHEEISGTFTNGYSQVIQILADFYDTRVMRKADQMSTTKENALNLSYKHTKKPYDRIKMRVVNLQV